ncbi:MAG: TonB-dependent receptor [Winogradskyella sp.]
MKQIIHIVVCLLCTNVFAQQQIKGKVLDASTNIPLDFVTLYVPELETGTTTNKNGVFSIKIPNGKYKLIASSIGYKTQSLTISIPLKTDLLITLSESAIEMEEIIISTPFHKLQSENVMKVEQKKITELKANGAITLAEGITSITGVESISTGNSIGKPVIRGLSSNRVLVYTQNVRLENQQFGDEHGLGINDAGVESVEIIKGPASLLYGSDALGGVLYINPERFATKNSANADAAVNYFSNTKGYATNAGYKSSSNRFKFLFRGSLTEHSDYKTNTYRVTNTRYREQDFKTGLGYQSSKFKTEFRYNVNTSKIGLPEEIGIQSTNRTPLLPYQHIDNHIFSSKSKLFFNNSSLDITLGYLYNNRQEFEDHHHHEEENDDDEDEIHEDDKILEPALHMKLKTFSYNVKYNLPKLGRFETIVGLQGINQSHTNYGEERLIPNATTNDFGILAVSHIHFKTLDIQLGTRYDHRKIAIKNNANQNFNAFNGALGFKTNLLEKITARLNLASGFRAPNLAELASNGTHEGTNRYEIGNLNLKNEQNFQADLALEFKNQHIEFFVNAFYNKITNYIFLTPNGDVVNQDPVFIYKQENANLYGGEIGFHLHPHPLDWLHFESSFETVTGKQANGNYLPLIPANAITNTIRVEYNSKFFQNNYAFIKLKSTFAQNNTSNFETSSPAYHLLSAGFGGTVTIFNKALNVTIAATNITDKTYTHHLSRLKPDGIFNPGRNIMLGLTYSL